MLAIAYFLRTFLIFFTFFLVDFSGSSYRIQSLSLWISEEIDDEFHLT